MSKPECIEPMHLRDGQNFLRRDTTSTQPQFGGYINLFPPRFLSIPPNSTHTHKPLYLRVFTPAFLLHLRFIRCFDYSVVTTS